MSPLETQRLILRPWLMTDLDDLFEYSQDERVGSMAGWKPHATKADALNALEQYMLQEHHWAIVDKKKRQSDRSNKTKPRQQPRKVLCKGNQLCAFSELLGKRNYDGSC